MAIEKLKKQIILEIEKAFKKAFSKKPSKLELGFPPDIKLGDFALSFFEDAKELKMSPAEVAKKMADSFKDSKIINEAKATGPYLNIKIKNEILFGTIISEIEKEKEKFGDSKIGKGKKVMVEYLSPNTNKPLHLGHARNGSIGMAIANILQANGYGVIKAILINDRGVHICKSMLAWQKWGNSETPESSGMKGDHLVGKYYVRYAIEAEKNPELEKEVQEMLQKWEAGDKEVLEVWKTMNGWAYAGYEETFQKIGFKFDEFFYESKLYKLGKDIVEEGLKMKIFYKGENGAVLFDLPEDEFGLDKDGKPKKVTIIRSDGTSVYITQDLGTAVTRAEKFKLDQMIYVVGSEQIYYFKTLFKILEALGYPWAKKLYHLSYGMVNLPEGKMKSREGKIVDADDLIKEVEKIVSVQIKAHDPEIEEGELKKRAEKVAIGAIKFYLLRVKPQQDITFDPKESVALDGFTGPYCQYAYARISGIIRNAEGQSFAADFSLLGNVEELGLAQKLVQFPDEIKKASEELNPLRVANAVYEIAKAFNLFYNNHQVLKEEDRKLSSARLELAKAAGEAIKKGLGVLGIDILERM